MNKFLLLAPLLLLFSACTNTMTPIIITPSDTPVSTPIGASTNLSEANFNFSEELCDFPYRPIYGYSPVYYDDNGLEDWPTAAPEEVGMDAEKLESAYDQLKTNPDVYSYLIIRHGKIVFEHYFNHANAQQSSAIHSVTKGFLSTMIGIAIDQGVITNERQRIQTFFPEIYAQMNDPHKNTITIKHLLTMQSGLDWTENVTIYPGETAWSPFILAQPLVSEPGQFFNYSNGNAHLLSEILTKSTGMNACEFAYRYLLGPLDISLEYWGTDPTGVFDGGNQMFMTPREMAKLGQLYLNKGQWQGKQIVSEEWIRKSFQKSIILQATEQNGYGFMWWIHNVNGNSVYSAWGYGGQFVHIIPALDLVVVSTSFEGSHNGENIDLESVIENQIIPAVLDR
jgi:CubicO group peptidase (beta-lactamase class C family)